MNLMMSSCLNILWLGLGLSPEIFLGLWTLPVHFLCPFFFTFNFLENNVDNRNTLAYAYPNQGTVITIQVYQCWFWSVWLGRLLDYLPRSETNFDIYRILQNRILTSAWVSKNSSHEINILGGSHFFESRLLYLLSNSNTFNLQTGAVA